MGGLGRPRALGASWSELEPQEALGGLRRPWEALGGLRPWEQAGVNWSLGRPWEASEGLGRPCEASGLGSKLE